MVTSRCSLLSWDLGVPETWDLLFQNGESPEQTGMSAPLVSAPLVPASPTCLVQHTTQALFSSYVYDIKAGWEAQFPHL